MSSPPPSNLKITRLGNAILATAFMVLLWLPTLDTFFHFDHSPAFNEKRLPAQFPKFEPGFAGLKKYFGGLESYYNDHFGFRYQLIHWHIQLQMELFNSGNGNVLIGKDGWLFMDGKQMAENYQGLLQFSPQELLDLQNSQERRRDWLAQRGIEYIFIVAPDKQSICPEYLPSWLKPIRHHTKLDQFIDYMHTHSTVTILDLRPALRDAKRLAPTYYKTDSHWNNLGAFVVSQEIVKVVAKKTPGLEPLPLSSFELKKEHFKSGDLATMLGVVASEDAITPMPKTNLLLFADTNPNPDLERPISFTSNSNARQTCVVFGDSFAGALRPYLGNYFKEVCYMRDPCNFNTDLIGKMKPDFFLNEIVERSFDSLGPRLEAPPTNDKN